MTCDQHRPPPLRRPSSVLNGACMQGIWQRRRRRTAHMHPVAGRRLIHLTCPPEEAIGGVGLLVPLAAADHGPTPIDCSLDRQSHLLTHCTSIHRSTKTQQQNRRRHQRKLLLGGGVSTVLSLASMNVPGILSRPYYACILAVTGIVRNDGRCPGVYSAQAG